MTLFFSAIPQCAVVAQNDVMFSHELFCFNNALMMESVITSETSVNFYHATLRNIPKDSHLHTCHLENQ
jgi:hypothetical protein